MFERPHHRCMAVVLGALDASLLRDHRCYFGGGTAIVMRFGEYRESADMDFMVSDISAYRMLRRLVSAPAGIGVLFSSPAVVAQHGEVRADQYGIRTRIEAATAVIKFEIVFEARIDLEPPGPDDLLCGVATFTLRDMAASKLLANSDRWGDAGTWQRDLVDLAMLEISREDMEAALLKAEAAYGASIRRDLRAAIKAVTSREGWLDRCMQALSIQLPKAVLWQRIRRLERYCLAG